MSDQNSISENRRDFCYNLFHVAIDAACPDQVLHHYLPPAPKGKCVVVGAGKGVVQLVQALEKVWSNPISGVVVTRYGYQMGQQSHNIRILNAGHPIPDQAGLDASHAILQAVEDLGAQDLVIALICGGGSALLPALPEGISLEDDAQLAKNLLASGINITDMNILRSAFSTIKAGRLAQKAFPARVCSLLVSDVAGDDPALIASGPTVPAKNHHARRFLELYQKHQELIPQAMQTYYRSGQVSFPDAEDPIFANHHHHVIASNGQSLQAAAQCAQYAGYEVTLLSDAVEGLATQIAREHGEYIRQLHAAEKRGVWLSGGELTVEHDGKGGQGGPNSEYILALSKEIAGLDRVVAFAADSDGIDGCGHHAGAWADGLTYHRMLDQQLNPDHALSSHDSATALAGVDALFSPGPTGTNVNDIRCWILD